MLLAAVVVGAVASTLVVGAEADPAAAERPSRSISWMATGDSYSSGEGSTEAAGGCQISSNAYAPVAQRMLARDRWQFDAFVHTACTGAVSPQLFAVPGGDGKTFYDWAAWDAATVDPSFDVFDLVTFTFGGNDIGFARSIKDCIGGGVYGIATNWSEGETRGWGDLLGTNDRCDFTAAQKQAEIDDTLRWGIDYAPERTGSLADLYTYTARTALAPGGMLVVVGYPELFAGEFDRPPWETTRCQGVTTEDVDMLNDLARHLNTTISNYVTEANTRLEGTDRTVRFFDVSPFFHTHRLCDADPWINDIRTARSQGRIEKAFHPNDSGYDREGVELAALLLDAEWDQPTPAVHDAPTCADAERIAEVLFDTGTTRTLLAHAGYDDRAGLLRVFGADLNSGELAFQFFPDRHDGDFLGGAAIVRSGTWLERETYHEGHPGDERTPALDAYQQRDQGITMKVSRVGAGLNVQGCVDLLLHSWDPKAAEGIAAVGGRPMPSAGFHSVSWVSPPDRMFHDEDTVGFMTPSGDVTCVWRADTGGLTCGAISRQPPLPPAPPESQCPLDWMDEAVTINKGSVQDGVCTGGLVLPYGANTLEHGWTLTFGNFACRSEQEGVTCKDLSSGAGFEFSPTHFTIL